MGAYLIDHPPVRDQWYAKRNRPLTGCTVLHSTESVFDEIGEDTGAEGVAEFIRRRTTPGSYHDIVDSDSEVYLVDYDHGAYHDGTGSNNWALALAFACRTVDWNRMSPAKRKAMLRRGAIAFARQQAYRRSVGAPLTELRLITKAQSDAGMSGFTYHGLRDPDRRSDPGVAPPNLFPFDEWIAECRAALGGTATPIPLGDTDMRTYIDNKGNIWKGTDFTLLWIGSAETAALLERGGPPRIAVTEGELGKIRAEIQENSAALMLNVAKAAGGDVDAVIAGLAPTLTEAMASRTGATREEVEQVMRSFFAAAAAAGA